MHSIFLGFIATLFEFGFGFFLPASTTAWRCPNAFSQSFDGNTTTTRFERVRLLNADELLNLVKEIEIKVGQVKQLRSGSQGLVFHVRSFQDEDIAIKIQPTKDKNAVVHETNAHNAMYGQYKNAALKAVLDEINLAYPAIHMHWEENTLASELKNKFGPSQPALWMMESFDSLLDALSVFHESGGIHRDIKPTNILLSPKSNQNLIFTDFGIAYYDGSLANGTGMISGTPTHGSVSQFLGNPPRNLDDIVALRKVFFEMLMGQPLYLIPSKYIEKKKISIGHEKAIIPFLKFSAEKIALMMRIDVKSSLALMVDFLAASANEWRLLVNLGVEIFVQANTEAIAEEIFYERFIQDFLPAIIVNDTKRAIKILWSSPKIVADIARKKIYTGNRTHNTNGITFTDRDLRSLLVEGYSQAELEQLLERYYSPGMDFDVNVYEDLGPRRIDWPAYALAREEFRGEE